MIAEVKKHPDTDDLFFELPPEVLQRLGWDESTELQWIDNKDGSVMLKKRDEDQEMTEIEIEICDHDFMKIAELAQKNNITFDQQVQQIMVEYIELHEQQLPDSE